MKIALIGNGPSRNLFFSEENDFDKVIGCNVPPDDIKFDYVCAADMKPIMIAYGRPGQSKEYYRLAENHFKLVLGQRSNALLKNCKTEPAGKEHLQSFLTRMGYIYRVIPLWPDAEKFKQRHYSSGHMAFTFICEEWPDSEIHIFGFDSFFTGTSASWSVKIFNPDANQVQHYKKSYTNKSPTNSVGQWFNIWEVILNSEKNTSKKIILHGEEKFQDIPDAFKEKIEVKKHEILQEK